MPNLEVTREELEILIDAMMFHRIDTQPTCVGGLEYIEKIGNLHVKLEETLELWINGGLIEMPVSEKMKALGVASIHREYPPHDEGVGKGD